MEAWSFTRKNDASIPGEVRERAYHILFPAPDRYMRDPVGWIENILGEHLTSYQRIIVKSVVDHRRTSVPACHGPGKSFVASRVISWWLCTRPSGEAEVIWTAPTFRQVDGIIGKELRALAKKHPSLGITVTKTSRISRDGIEAGFGQSPANHDQHGFQGQHARYLLAIGDEACGLVENILTGINALLTNDDCRLLLLGNPDDPKSEFEKTCRPGSGYNIVRINALHTPNFTKELLTAYPDVDALMRELGIPYAAEYCPEDVRQRIVSPQYVQDALRQWGRASMQFQSKVLAEFPDVSSDTLITPAMIKAAEARELHGGTRGQWGVDVARFGPDRTIAIRNRGGKISLDYNAGQQDGTITKAALRRLMRAQRGVPMNIDAGGVGGFLIDDLASEDYPVVGIDFGGKALDPDKFVNRRAEMYWTAREAFQAELIDLDPELNELHEHLVNELQEIHYSYDSMGRLKIEPKDKIRKRLGISPDLADAFVLSLVVDTDLSAFDMDDAAPHMVSPAAEVATRRL